MILAVRHGRFVDLGGQCGGDEAHVIEHHRGLRVRVIHPLAMVPVDQGQSLGPPGLGPLGEARPEEGLLLLDARPRDDAKAQEHQRSEAGTPEKHEHGSDQLHETTSVQGPDLSTSTRDPGASVRRFRGCRHFEDRSPHAAR